MRSVRESAASVGGVEVVQHWSRDAQRADRPVHALVTGANGFIGRHLAEQLLADGKSVRVYVRRPESVEELRRLGAEVFIGGLDDVSALTQAAQGVEAVYHLAAMTSAFTPEEMFRVNRDGAENVARACLAQQHAPVLVQVSSVAAAGPTRLGALRRETDVPEPVSNYGRSKLAGEQAVAQFAADVPITIVRPGIVYGPRNREMLPMFHSIKYVHAHFVPGWRTPPLSLIHVDDCVDVLREAAAKGSRLPARSADPLEQLTSGRGLYFATADEYPSYADLGRLIRSILHRPLAPIVPLGPLSWLAARVNERIGRLRGRPDSFNRDKLREAAASSWACAAERARCDFSFQPRCSLKEGLESTAQWYQRERWL